MTHDPVETGINQLEGLRGAQDQYSNADRARYNSEKVRNQAGLLISDTQCKTNRYFYSTIHPLPYR